MFETDDPFQKISAKELSDLTGNTISEPALYLLFQPYYLKTKNEEKDLVGFWRYKSFEQCTILQIAIAFCFMRKNDAQVEFNFLGKKMTMGQVSYSFIEQFRH